MLFFLFFFFAFWYSSSFVFFWLFIACSCRVCYVIFLYVSGFWFVWICPTFSLSNLFFLSLSSRSWKLCAYERRGINGMECNGTKWSGVEWWHPSIMWLFGLSKWSSKEGQTKSKRRGLQPSPFSTHVRYTHTEKEMKWMPLREPETVEVRYAS